MKPWVTMSDEQIDAVHSAAGEALRSTLSALDEEARDALRRAQQIRAAIVEGAWWRLEGVLTNEQIELLCECEPFPRTAILGEETAAHMAGLCFNPVPQEAGCAHIGGSCDECGGETGWERPRGDRERFSAD